ncbi:GNAT family N-acetyltransferase [Streptomyces sp. TN58]|uniref:GNAT family N-acetyltransferase n=1 Tax=Streptomyces sp. TN58 TaxID=234612 RepID=UPI0009509C13|nr:GNAT family N-acetyltransferase [Streptomyces sp. TN58]APU44091.1 GNAT family N-acetyltransferase [Streptomyces sp. TN58]
MTDESVLRVAQITDVQEVDPALRQRLIDCWIEVTNSGGAAGFPFPPVGRGQVAPVADEVLRRLHPRRSRLVTAGFHGELAGWVLLRRDPDRLVGHWGSVHHLQTRPGFRRRGVASALMRELPRIARDELGLEQLHLAARGGEGLEDFYSGLGWREVGRWPGSLRLAADDTRDEVLMLLDAL